MSSNVARGRPQKAPGTAQTAQTARTARKARPLPPPPKKAASVPSGAPATRCKNPSRVPDSVYGSDPIHLARAVPVAWGPGATGPRPVVYGHRTGPGSLILEGDADPTVFDPATHVLEDVLECADVPPIPEAAGSCHPSFSEASFFQFETQEPFLFVAFATAPVIAEGTVEPWVSPGCPTVVGSSGATLVPWSNWPEVLPGDARPWVLSLQSAAQAPAVASRLLAAGAVAVSCAVASREEAAVPIRVKHTTLKWIKDAKYVKEVSAIVDQLPGLPDKPMEAPKGFSPALWSFVLYDQHFEVPRQLLTWGFFAARVNQAITPEQRGRVCEPLRSYIKALVEAEAIRTQQVSGIAPLEFNTAPKLSPAQTAHAMAVFYWACIHADDDSRPISQDDARRVLDMYLAHGDVVLKKRAYTFTAAPKRPRRVPANTEIDLDPAT